MPFKYNPFTANLDEVGSGGGAGDVVGPAVAVNDNFCAFDGITGKLIKDSGVTTSTFLQAANNLSDLSNDTTARQNLGVEIGVDVEAWSANLDEFSALTAVAGDIIYGNVTPEWTKLAKGSDGEVLTLAGGFPSWAAPTAATVFPYASKAASYTLTSSDYIIGVTDTSAARVMSLPAAPSTGQVFVIKDQSGAASNGNLSVDVTGGVVTIDGATSYVISSNYGSITVYFNGTNYSVI